MEEDKNTSSNDANREDHFTRLMFGDRGLREDHGHQQTPHKNLPDSPIDLDELMVNIDKLVESAKNLKPVLQKALPTLEKLWRKWKEDD